MKARPSFFNFADQIPVFEPLVNGNLKLTLVLI